MINKGYYAPSDNYITVTEIQRRKRQRIKEIKEIKTQKRLEEIKRQELYNIMYIAEKQEQKKLEDERQKLVEARANFIDGIGRFKLPYRQFLIAWDLLITEDLYQIKSDYQKGKIDKLDIETILLITPKNLITDYTGGYLLAL
jgi:hypothetical protein